MLNNRKEYLKRHYEENKPEILFKQKEYYKKNSKEINTKKSKYRQKEMIDAIKEYGGKCHICGEFRLWTLTLAHLNNDGGIRRKNGEGGGCLTAIKLKLLGYPKNLGIGVECFNCNVAANFSNSWRKNMRDEEFYGMVIV